jgi:hypothetical protein
MDSLITFVEVFKMGEVTGCDNHTEKSSLSVLKRCSSNTHDSETVIRLLPFYAMNPELFTMFEDFFSIMK